MSVIRRGLHVASKQVAYLVVILAAVLLFLVGAFYWLADAVDKRQDEIAVWAGDKIGYPIELGSAGLGWVGLMPKLQIDAVTVFRDDKQTQLLSIESLYVGLDLIASIQRGEPVLDELSLTGLKTTIIRNLTGQIELQGLSSSSSSSSLLIDDWLSWAKLLDSFQIHNTMINYIDDINQALSGSYRLTQAELNHQSKNWTVTGLLQLPSTLGSQLKFSSQGEFESDDYQTSRWQWQAQLDDLMLAPFSSLISWQDVRVQKGNITANITANGVGDTFDSIKTTLDLADLELVSKQENITHTPVLIDHLVANIDWQQQGQSWQASGRDINLTVNGEAWKATGFNIQKQQDDTWIIASDYLRLSDITSLAALSAHSPEIIRQQKPAGDIDSLQLRYSATKGILSLAFKLRDGAMLPWQNYPGVTGLTASVNWQQDSANLTLDSHKITFYPETWLADAVFFDSVTGKLDLRRQGNNWTLQSQALHFWNDDLSVQLDGSVQHTSDDKIINDLKITMEDVVVNRWQAYVPQKILSPNFKVWSKDAFLAGKIIDGTIELKGDLADFPYEEKPEKGQFKMTLQAENVQLHYGPKWPDLLGVTGTITGTGNDLVIKSPSGKIAGFNFSDVTTTITKLIEDKPILRVDGRLTGTTSDALLFLQNSPLKQRFGQVAGSAKAQGASNIKLNLMVPLADVDGTEASGYVSFIDSQLQPKLLPELVMSKINGKLYFSNKGVTADDIKASVLNEPVIINVKPKGDITLVSAMGEVSMSQIEKHWPNSLPKFISGKTPYELAVSISEEAVGNFNVDASIETDLRGIDITLPQPFAKLGKDSRHFRVATKKLSDTQAYFVEYDKSLTAALAHDEQQWRGEINIGGEQAKLANHGITIRGQFAELSLDEWLDWSKQIKTKTDQSNPFTASLNNVFMTVDKLTGFNQQFTDFTLTAKKETQGWRANINSQQSKGQVYWPSDFNSLTALKIDLDKLKISLPKSETKQQITDEQAQFLWPSMDLDIGALTINDMVLGQLKLRARRTENAWLLDEGSLVSDDFSASIPFGEWQQAESGDRSHFQIQANSDDLAGLLASFGYQQVVDAKGVDLFADLSWADNPLAVTTELLTGSLKIAVGKGQLNDVEPGAAGRIFGLMSIAALPRRLSLDFSDLFAKGFYFDSINGSFKFANGQAITNDFELKGASASIQMSGPVDLIHQQYDQKVKITPNVSSTLPLAGAVAGGPVGLGVGAALLLVDKLAGVMFDKNIVNLISYSYDLKGPWDAPSLTVAKP